MIRSNMVKDAREMAEKLRAVGKTVVVEYYKDGTEWHTDYCGDYIGNDYEEAETDDIPGSAWCEYQVMDRDEYGRTMLANTGTTAAEYFDELDRIIVVNVETSDHGGYVRTLTAEEVIERAKLEDEKTYMQTDTGETATGADWKETFRDIERRGGAACDSAFDSDGEGARLVEVEVAE